MKVALVLPAEPEMAPYIHYYINHLKNNHIDYDLIAWNRSGQNKKETPNLVIYDKKSEDSLGWYKKLKGYRGFRDFAEKKIRDNHYDILIVHTILAAVMLRKTLLKHYPHRFVLDIRDRGAIYPFLKRPLKKLLASSSFNVISSPGFKQWLPQASFCLSHNIGPNGLNFPKTENKTFFSAPQITVLSIGQIRFFQANQYIIDALANQPGFYMRYAGYGQDSERLQSYCKSRNINNVCFSGKYVKTEEPEIVKNCDFINIIFPKVSGTLSAMPNRFYTAALYHKPVIVTAQSVQADYVQKYKLGIVVDNKENLLQKINSYIEHFNPQEYKQGCQDFIQEIEHDVRDFEAHLLGLIDTYQKHGK